MPSGSASELRSSSTAAASTELARSSRATVSAAASSSPRAGGPCTSPGGSCRRNRGRLQRTCGWLSTLHRMERELFEHYLTDDSRLGPPADGAFIGAAGGAACGDLSRISFLV